MEKINVDTTKMKEAGNNIIVATRDFSKDIANLKKRIEKMTTETYEWEGNSADKFVTIVSSQLLELDSFIATLNEYGEELITTAQNYENTANYTTIK